MWNGRLVRFTVAKHRIVLSPQNAPFKNSALYRADPKQRELERKDVEKMQEAILVKPAVTERPSPVVLVSKED